MALPMPQSRAPLTVFTASQTGARPRQSPDSISPAIPVAVPTDSGGFQLQLDSQARADRLANASAYMNTTGEQCTGWRCAQTRLQYLSGDTLSNP